MTLDPKQIRVRDFILAYQEKNGRRPSYKEIMVATDVKNLVTVHRAVRRLEKAGELTLVYVRPHPGQILIPAQTKINHPLYGVWSNMITRCTNPKTPGFHRYGGRGIAVCDQWRDDSSEFIAWAEANGYRNGLQIDRIDNDRGYSPDNCRFVTPKENARNRPRSRSTQAPQ